MSSERAAAATPIVAVYGASGLAGAALCRALAANPSPNPNPSPSPSPSPNPSPNPIPIPIPIPIPNPIPNPIPIPIPIPISIPNPNPIPHPIPVPSGVVDAGIALRLVGRDRQRLEALAATLPVAVELRVAAADDRAALQEAFAGCRVVVDAAGPFAPLGDEVVTSAIAAGCHYLDLCAEQAVIRRVFERCDAAARHGQVAVVPAAGFSAAMGDLLAARATALLLDHHDDGPTVRQAPGPRLGSAEPGEPPLGIAVGYLFDELSLSPGAQASVFANLHAEVVAWRRDRWDAERPGRRQRTFDPGAAPGEDAPVVREAFSLGGGDNLTIPRHVAAHDVDTYVSLSRSPGVHRALRLAALAAAWLPAAASSLLVPARTADEDYAATRFAVIASAERARDQRRAVAFGRDLYATSTAITARLALALAHRPPSVGPVGVLAPAEIVRAPRFLAELARDGVITLG